MKTRIMLSLLPHLRQTACIALVLFSACLSPYPDFELYSTPNMADMSLPEPSGGAEVECNGLDDDGDGQIDEFRQRECERGQGICITSGIKQCVSGPSGLQVSCIGDVPLMPQTESCLDDLDEDCDGRVDENCQCTIGTLQACYTGAPATRNVGACSDGEQVCGDDGLYGPCQNDLTPTEEVCDGVDNDCDDLVDEGQFPCLSGQCQGTATCSEGVLINCSARSEAEVCDNMDNDCDGQIDEAVQTDPDACPRINTCLQRQVCVNAQLRCEQEPSQDCFCEALTDVSERHFLCANNEVDFDTAQASCQTNDLGSLAELNSNSEHRALFHALQSRGEMETYWIGATRSSRVANWLTGTSVDTHLFKTGTLDRSNVNNRVEFDGANGLYQPRSKTTFLPFICERSCDANDVDGDGFSACAGDCRPLNEQVHPGKPEHVGDQIDNNCNGIVDELGPELCVDDADNDGDGIIDEPACINDCAEFWFRDRMYLTCSRNLLWRQAKSECELIPRGQMATFTRAQEWRQIWSWYGESFTPLRNDYWFGLSKLSTGSWQFVDGSIINSQNPEIWSSWAPGMPDDFLSDEDCGELWCDGENQCNGTWNDQNCDNPRPYICEMQP